MIRYDKRTKVYGADSAPAGKEITFDEESVDDALSAVKLAESIPTIDPGRIYILGHSLGGTLAPRIAQCSDKTPAGIILLAGAARPLEDLFISQVKYLASALPSTNDIQKDIAQLQKQVDNVKKLDTDTFDITIPLPMNLPQLSRSTQAVKPLNPGTARRSEPPRRYGDVPKFPKESNAGPTPVHKHHVPALHPTYKALVL